EAARGLGIAARLCARLCRHDAAFLPLLRRHRPGARAQGRALGRPARRRHRLPSFPDALNAASLDRYDSATSDSDASVVDASSGGADASPADLVVPRALLILRPDCSDPTGWGVKL